MLGLRRLSKEALLGATFGGYVIATFVLVFWGEGLLLPTYVISWPPKPPQEHPGALLLLIPGVVVAFLSILQVFFCRQISERLTNLSLQGNFLAILGFCLVLAMAGERDLVVIGVLGALLCAVCFPLGLLSSVVNVIGGYVRKSSRTT